MDILKINDGLSVVIDDSPIEQGYCLDVGTNEIVYYNGDYGETPPSTLKRITHSSSKLEGTIHIVTAETLRTELEFWTGYEPCNGMGKYGRSVRMESLKKQINQIENLKTEIYESEAKARND